jgi:DNA polymerase-3 subunit delta'
MPYTVTGQDAAVRSLRAALTDGRLSHAYLFAGPEHVGKTRTALQFAQALNCDGDDPPCGRCRPCERIASGSHPDVEIVTIGGLCIPPPNENHDHSRDNSRGIRICQVRRLQSVVSRAPFEGRYRVMIVEPADALIREAEVALLKTLEEPPAQVVIILITNRADALLDTIRSRARLVTFGGMPRAAVESALRNRWDVEASHASELARLSGGRLGWAVIALHDERMIEDRASALADAERIATAPLADRFAWAGEVGGRFSRDRAAVQQTLALWEEWWRDILLITAGREELAVHREGIERMRHLAAGCDTAAAARALRALADARQQLDENASPVLALEVMMLALPHLRPNAVTARLADR